jgi:hypothetical protein
LHVHPTSGHPAGYPELHLVYRSDISAPDGILPYLYFLSVTPTPLLILKSAIAPPPPSGTRTFHTSCSRQVSRLSSFWRSRMSAAIPSSRRKFPPCKSYRLSLLPSCAP